MAIWDYSSNSFAAWELGMALLSMGIPESPILRFSVIGWALIIVDSASLIVWPDMALLIYSGFLLRELMHLALNERN